MKTVAVVTACLVMLLLASTGAWANAIPPQITLSSSSRGGVTFSNTGTSVDFWFNGTTAQCGHTGCVGGNALLEPQTLLGTYSMWITGGTPTMTGGPSNYTVNMNGASIHLAVTLTGFPDTLTSTLTLADLFGGGSMVPNFDGTFGNTVSSGLYLGADFPNGSIGTLDFTVKLGSGPTVGTLPGGQQIDGYISSGELVPSAPEPSTLALMGTGVLGLAAAIRYKMRP